MAAGSTMEKFRKRMQVPVSVGIKAVSGGSVYGLMNQAGTITVSDSTGTARAGSAGLVDLTGVRLRLPARAALVGTSSVDFSNAAGCGGSEGQVRFGFNSASAQMGVIIGGTVFVLNWATAGGAVSAIASPAGAA